MGRAGEIFLRPWLALDKGVGRRNPVIFIKSDYVLSDIRFCKGPIIGFSASKFKFHIYAADEPLAAMRAGLLAPGYPEGSPASH
jgi:hypothetical protein